MSQPARVLEDFLSPPRVPIFDISMTALDGYLTAVVIGPSMIMPSEWMAGLWAKEHGFEDLNDAQKVMGALMEYYNEVIRKLDGPPENYRPLYLPEDPAEPVSVARAEEWSQGFLRAMKFDDWTPLTQDEDARVLLVPIVSFIKDDKGKNALGFTRHKLQEIVTDSTDVMAEFILLMREFWREQADQQDMPSYAQPPSRNQLCPCGSGKKYKRCCGAD